MGDGNFHVILPFDPKNKESYKKINLGDKDILIDYLNKNGLEGSDIIEQTSNDAIKQKLIKNTEEAVAMGAFGVPTFFIDEQMFWGKEALREMPNYF